ncbi:MAG: excinuclease ABC subunit UvrC [Bacteroidales bacterium]|nr:excinuclease ABC subunit UvrC [Bacteroidales bacterium]
MLLKDDEALLRNTIRALPDSPGVYLYSGEDGAIIYVGKAKSLKKRIPQYFKKDVTGKTKVLVGKIATVNTIVVNSESDAFLLENTLIKKHQPRYNILLKDDKTYPWLCIKNERFPRIIKTRNKVNDGSEYFGPYSSVKMLRTLMEVIEKLYPLRTCRHNLTEESVHRKKYGLCLKYHIGKCLGPCAGIQSEEEYDKIVKEVRNIIAGNISFVIKEIEKEMFAYAEKMEFEKAQTAKDKIEILRNYCSKSMVASSTIKDVDVFSITSDKDIAYINYMKVVNGLLVQVHTIEAKKKMDEADDYILTYIISDFIGNMRDADTVSKDNNIREIIIPFIPSIDFQGVKYTVPRIGEKKHLLELSERNLKYYILEKEKKKSLVDPEFKNERLLTKMKNDLRMNEIPRRIECFDNSNLQGTNAVASMVCFIDGKPAKSQYRHYNIKTVEGPNDFASMEEVIFRRYKRVMEECTEMPQLIIVDGGKGQLSSALISLDKLGLRGKVTIIGIAKRLEEIYFPGDEYPLYLGKDSETLKLIQRLRDEAHRFGITHHRNKRSKEMLKEKRKDKKNGNR